MGQEMANLQQQQEQQNQNWRLCSSTSTFGHLIEQPRQQLAWGMMKALVWFWLIDEILSANLVYQSDYEIGGLFQVVKQMKIMT